MKKRCSIILAKILVFCMIINLMGQFNISMVSIALTSANLSTDDAGVKFIKSHEGLRLTAYKATESETYYTIGYGHCGSDVYAGMTITEAQAEQFLRNDLKVKENNVRRQTSGLEMSQSQFNALVSLCYNTGGGTSIISNSPLVKYLRGELSESQARSQYSSYCVYSGNKKLQGLVNRRNDEANLFFTNDVPKPCQINDISGYGGPTEGYVHTPGANCGLYGTITSNHPLKHVWGGVYKQDGTKAPGSSTTCDDYPNTTSYSLRGTFNNTIIFDDIPVGSYFFSISAEDSDGYSREVYHCNFTVGNPSITVSFNANGGTVSPTSKTYSIGGKYSDMPTPTREGYIFAGWFTENGEQKSNGSPIVSNSNHTLYARWSINNYTVTLDSCGGNVSSGSITVSHGGNYSGLPTPSKTGYSFAGWYTSDGTKVSDGTAIVSNSNHTLYAHWTAREYKLCLNYNDGNSEIKTFSPNLIYNSGNWWNIGQSERDGYTLTGYFTSAEGGTKVYDSNGECINGCGYWNEGKYVNDEDLTIYAQWTPDTYTVKLNANGGTVSSESVQVTYDSTYNNLPNPERTGYIVILF